MITLATVKKIYKKRKATAHKGTAGHILLIGGSYGKMGAMVLCSSAAMRAGSGLVTAFVPCCGCDILQTAIPEVMVLTDKNSKIITDIKFDISVKAIGIGPGMGTEFKTRYAFKQFLESVTVPLILDADALNILFFQKEYLQLLQKDSILTPHRKELERLVGTFNSDEQMLQLTQDFCKLYKVVVVAKGAPTYIVTSNAVFENKIKNAALATAGSGDVLTGIITSLRGQGYSAVNACILGVYLHSKTADIASPSIGVESFIASDIITNIGQAFLSLQ